MSVIHMIILWNWLADNPVQVKTDHPWLGVWAWRAGCSLCEYSYDVDKKRPCNVCPLVDRWPGPHGYTHSCGFSAYESWEQNLSSLYDREFFALILAEEAELLLSELVIQPKED